MIPFRKNIDALQNSDGLSGVKQPDFAMVVRNNFGLARRLSRI
jgi:hypothetical protein